MRLGGVHSENVDLGTSAWLWAAVIWTVVTFVLVVAIVGHSASEPDHRLEAREVLSGLAVIWMVGVAATVVSGSTIARRTAQSRAIDRSYRRLFEALPDAAFVLEWRDGAFGPLSEVNPAACRLLGCDRETLLASRLSDVFEGSTPELVASGSARITESGRLETEQRLVTPQGMLPVHAQFQRFESAGRPSVLLILKDLGDRKAAEWALRRRDTQLTELSSATRRVNEDLREDVVLRRLVESAMQVVGATAGMAGLFVKDHVEYAEYADAEGFHPLGLSLPVTAGLTGIVWETLAVFRTNDAQRDLQRHTAFEERFQPASVLAAPILSRDGLPLGCLELHDKAGGEPFEEEDALIVLGLAASGAIALENARLLEQQAEWQRALVEREDRLQRLAAELSRTEEQGRRRIAELLHDRIGQELAVLRMRLGQMTTSTGKEEHGKLAQEVRQLLDQAIADTRALTFEISPPMLYTLGLASALEWLCEQLEQQHHVAMTLHNDTRGRRVSDDARALLYISVRELLMNVVKHANATSADVRMTIVGEWLWLAVVDDGDGFVPEEAEATSADGFGLFSIRERLAGIGGSMVIRSAPGKGAEVVLEAPLEQETSAREVEDLARDRG